MTDGVYLFEKFGRIGNITSSSDSSSIFNATFIQLFIAQILSMMTIVCLSSLVPIRLIPIMLTTMAGLITGMTLLVPWFARFSAGIMTAKFRAKI